MESFTAETIICKMTKIKHIFTVIICKWVKLVIKEKIHIGQEKNVLVILFLPPRALLQSFLLCSVLQEANS